jgi:hypothetical protein
MIFDPSGAIELDRGHGDVELELSWIQANRLLVSLWTELRT